MFSELMLTLKSWLGLTSHTIHWSVARVDAELVAIGQCRLRVHGTCGQKNSRHHLRKMSSWVGNPRRPLYVTPRGSAGRKKKKKDVRCVRLLKNLLLNCKQTHAQSKHRSFDFRDQWPPTSERNEEDRKSRNLYFSNRDCLHLRHN